METVCQPRRRRLALWAIVGLLGLPAVVAQGFVDAMIRNAGELVFIGTNVYQAQWQTRAQTVHAGNPAVYEFQVWYFGPATDTVRLLGSGGGGGWTVRYFDALAGGADITREVTGDIGYAWTNVPPGAVQPFRAEVTPGITVGSNQGTDLIVTAHAASNPDRQDTTRAVTRCAARTQPDLMVRREFDLRYAGDNTYNRTGVGQTKTQTTDPTVPASFFVQVANDGNQTDRFLVRGQADGAAWTVRYFDALVGGFEITELVAGPGWLSPPMLLNATRELRIEVSGRVDVQGVSTNAVQLDATSENDPTRSDAVRAITANLADCTTPQGGVYTADADFEKGSLAGVTYSVVPDQLQLAAERVTFPFIWVPNSNEGTVSKVETRTGRELARYYTGPWFLNTDPSRTTIDQQGSCWVANRQTGSAIKIGLSENGQYADRNHDGIIQTSTDLNNDGDIIGEELLPWGEDECVLWEVILIDGHEGTFVPGTFPGDYADNHWNPGPRGVAVDAQGNVWLGTYQSKKFYHVDGATGRILRTVDFASVNHNSYGAVVDAQGIVWSSGLQNQNLLRLDPADGGFSIVNLGHSVYGLGLDQSNHLFVAGWTSAMLSRLNVLTGEVEWTVPGVDQSRGVTVTSDGDVWTADSSPGTVTRWSNDGVIKATIPVGETPTGVTVDAAGKVWVVNYGDEYIKRIDPVTDQVDLEKWIVGGWHYGYSDMTGILSRTVTTRMGLWTITHDAQFPGAAWGTLSWSAAVPHGTRVAVRARSSSDRRRWSFWEPATNSLPLNGTPPGRFLEVEVTLQTLEGDASPVFHDLTVAPAGQDLRRPHLESRLVDGLQFELSWDPAVTNATLEAADWLPGAWSRLAPVVGNRYLTPIPPNRQARFYRLRVERADGHRAIESLKIQAGEGHEP